MTSPQKNTKQTQGTTGLSSNIASLLCYICPPIISVIFLVIEKQDKDVRFHAWQGTLFGIGWIVILIAFEILAAIMGAIASILGIIISFFIPLILLGLFILWIVCVIKAYQGERWKIPILGDYAEKRT